MEIPCDYRDGESSGGDGESGDGHGHGHSEGDCDKSNGAIVCWCDGVIV